MKDIMTFLLILCLGFAVCEEGVKTLEEQSKPLNVKTMTVKANQEFIIPLKDSPSAGFSWKLLNEDTLKFSTAVTFIKKEYIRPVKIDRRFALVGGPLHVNFIFKAGEPTNDAVVLEFGFGRGWLKTFDRTLKYEITIAN